MGMFKNIKDGWINYLKSGKPKGLPEEVDLLVEGDIKIQAKCRKQIPKFLGMTENVDMVAFKEDRGEIYLMMRIDDYLKEIKGLKDRIWELSNGKSF